MHIDSAIWFSICTPLTMHTHKKKNNTCRHSFSYIFCTAQNASQQNCCTTSWKNVIVSTPIESIHKKHTSHLQVHKLSATQHTCCKSQSRLHDYDKPRAHNQNQLGIEGNTQAESCPLTCWCFETQCFNTFSTRMVAAVLITDSRFFIGRRSNAPVTPTNNSRGKCLLISF